MPGIWNRYGGYAKSNMRNKFESISTRISRDENPLGKIIFWERFALDYLMATILTFSNLEMLRIRNNNIYLYCTLWRLIVYSRLTTSLMADLGFLSRAILFFMIRFQSENKKKWYLISNCHSLTETQNYRDFLCFFVANKISTLLGECLLATWCSGISEFGESSSKLLDFD